MRTLTVAIASVLVCGVVVTAAGDRIYTNPKPEAHLKKLFPTAVAFSPLAGTPLHYTAHAVDPQKDPKAPPLGYAFWTTDLVPSEHGYHGPIHLMVGIDLKGIITGVVLDYDSEPYGYFSVQLKEFADQFVNKSIRAPFRVGDDVDAVSRATLSISSATRAVRDSSRLMARALLSPSAVVR